MRMRIQIPNDIKIEDLDTLIEEGAKFVAYQYVISVPLFFPTKRLSKLYYIGPSENPAKFCFIYNLLCLMLGFWGMPFGPPVMVVAIMTNLKGGIDFTEDVMVNLKPDSLSSKSIEMEKPSRFFLHPSKQNYKELNKVFKAIRKHHILMEPVIAGYFINTAMDEKPYHVIGISTELKNETIQLIRDELIKKFYKHAKFEIVSLLNDDYEFVDRLKNEGIKLTEE